MPPPTFSDAMTAAAGPTLTTPTTMTAGGGTPLDPTPNVTVGAEGRASSLRALGWGDCLALLLMAALVVTAVAGNVCNLAVIARSSSLRHSLSNFFIVSLCTGDLLAALTVMPAAALTFALGPVWLSPAACSVVACATAFFMFVSMTSLSVISVERYYSIRLPMHHAAHMSVTKTGVALGLVWLWSGLLAALPLLGVGSYHAPATPAHCYLSWRAGGAGAGQRAYVTLVTSLCFLLPGGVILSMYAAIFRVARQAAVQVRPIPYSGATTSLPRGDPPPSLTWARPAPTPLPAPRDLDRKAGAADRRAEVGGVSSGSSAPAGRSGDTAGGGDGPTCGWRERGAVSTNSVGKGTMQDKDPSRPRSGDDESDEPDLPAVNNDAGAAIRSPDPAGSTPPRPVTRSPDPAGSTPPRQGTRSPDPTGSTPPRPVTRSPDPAGSTPPRPVTRSPDPAGSTPPRPVTRSPDPAGSTPPRPVTRSPDPAGSTPPRPVTRSPDPAGSTPPRPVTRSPDPAGSTPPRPVTRSPDPTGSTPPRPVTRSPDPAVSTPPNASNAGAKPDRSRSIEDSGIASGDGETVDGRRGTGDMVLRVNTARAPLKSHLKAAKTLLLLLAAYVVLWGPYFVLQLHGVFGGPEDEVGEVAALWLGLASFAANPFLYGWMNKAIREELVLLHRRLCCCCRRCCCREAREEEVGMVGQSNEDFLQFLERTSCAAPGARAGDGRRRRVERAPGDSRMDVSQANVDSSDPFG